jgi:predicted 3-demethylubiquinone-9 3-methyltransferase (glyoxalase superfamily)
MSADNKIVPNLWFDREAEEAANFYIAAFGGDGRIVSTVPASPDAPSPQDVPMVVEFELRGQRLVGINGGPMFKFNEAISLEVRVADQEELDRVWAALTDGGEEGPCGWLKDKYGLSWQVTPDAYNEMMDSGDDAAKQRLLSALLSTVGKYDIAALRAAFDGV